MNRTAALGLGANVGDALATLEAAVYALDDVDGLAVVDVSGVYETPPWPPRGEPGAVEQPNYLNLVVRAICSLPARDLLAETQLIEAAFGRDRRREVRWGPRTLDIDLLLFGDEEIDEPDLVVPHPRLAERAFVLIPMLEVLPGWALPDGRRLTQLISALAPIEDLDLVVRLQDVPGRRVARPEGPTGPPASFRRPGIDPSPDDARPQGPGQALPDGSTRGGS